MKVDWPGQVFGGVLRIDNRADFANAIRAEFEGHDCFVNVQVSNAARTRSNRQNSYLWGIPYRLLADYTGYSPEEVHEICKMKFLSRHYAIMGEDIDATASTTKLTTIEFEEYATAIRHWGATLGLNIPEPNEETNPQP
jgi:hypothetical protein